MKFRVERDVLAEAVTWVARGLPARPPVPVLAGVLLVADEKGTLTLSAFDYEVSAKVTVPADVAEPGTVLVLGRLLADISRNLPARPIDVATDGNKVEVTCGSSRFSLLIMPVRRLPDAARRAGADGHHRRRRVHARPSPRSRSRPTAVTRCPSSPVSACEIEGDKVTLLATDRYRLAMRELHVESRRPRRQPRRAGPGPHPVRHRQGARRLPARWSSPSVAPPAATG